MRRAALVIVAAAAAVACNGLLGLGDPTLDPSIGQDDSGSTSDGPAPPMDGTGPDTAVPCTSATDTTSDPHNCGKCGHDCLGGGCQASMCQPVVVVPADGTYQPQFMALDGAGNLFFISNAQAVFGVDLSSDKIRPIFPADGKLTNLSSVAAGGGYVYFTNNAAGTMGMGGAVLSCSTMGCMTQRNNILTDSVFFPDWVVWDGMNAFFSLQTPAPDGAIYRCPDAACKVPVAVTTTDFPSRFGVDDTNIIFSPDPFTGTSDLWTCLKTGGTSKRIYTDPNVNNLTVDKGQVFWVDTDGTVKQGTPAGGMAQVVATTPPSAVSIRTDTNTIYWSVAANSSPYAGPLVSCPKAGPCTTQTTVVTSVNNLWDIQVDDKFVYYDSADDHGIWKVAK